MAESTRRERSGEDNGSFEFRTNKICKSLSSNFNDIVSVSKERLAKDEAYLLDSSKLRNELNWKECFNIEDGIIETISWVRDNFEIIKNLPLKYEHKL